jgi:hypothetical protein
MKSYTHHANGCGDRHSYLTSILEWGKRPSSRLGRFNPGRELLYIEREVWWAPGTVWTFWTRVKSLALSGFESRLLVSRNLVIIFDTRSLFLFIKHELIFEDLNYLEAIFLSFIMVYAERCMAHKFEAEAGNKLVVALAIKITFNGLLIRNIYMYFKIPRRLL